jgi:hypothetical protein
MTGCGYKYLGNISTLSTRLPYISTQCSFYSFHTTLAATNTTVFGPSISSPLRPEFIQQKSSATSNDLLFGTDGGNVRGAGFVPFKETTCSI